MSKRIVKPKAAVTVAGYLAQLPADRRNIVSGVRSIIKKNLPSGYIEGISYGMISYSIPLARYPQTYNGQPLMFAALASQRQHFSLYLMCVYGNPTLGTWFINEWKKTGKKLNMGKACIRFNRLEDVPLSLIGRLIRKVTVAKYIHFYELARPTR